MHYDVHLIENVKLYKNRLWVVVLRLAIRARKVGKTLLLTLV